MRCCCSILPTSYAARSRVRPPTPSPRYTSRSVQGGEPARDLRRPARDQYGRCARGVRGKRYSELKGAVADAVIDALVPIQARYVELRADDDGLRRALAESAARVRLVADATLLRVQEAVGLR